MSRQRALWAGILYAVGLMLLILGGAFTLLVLVTGGGLHLPQSANGFVQGVNTLLGAMQSSSPLLLVTGLGLMAAGKNQLAQSHLARQAHELEARVAALEGELETLRGQLARSRENQAPAAFDPPAYASGVPRRRRRRTEYMQDMGETQEEPQA